MMKILAILFLIATSIVIANACTQEKVYMTTTDGVTPDYWFVVDYGLPTLPATTIANTPDSGYMYIGDPSSSDFGSFVLYYGPTGERMGFSYLPGCMAPSLRINSTVTTSFSVKNGNLYAYLDFSKMSYQPFEYSWYCVSQCSGCPVSQIVEVPVGVVNYGTYAFVTAMLSTNTTASQIQFLNMGQQPVSLEQAICGGANTPTLSFFLILFFIILQITL